MPRERVRSPDGATTTWRVVEGVPATRVLNLASYNYLGFGNKDPYCTPAVVEAVERYGASTCAPGTDGGHSLPVACLEEKIAEFVGKEAAVVIGMGFATNTTVLPCLVGPGSLVLSDALNHTSLVLGVRGSGAACRVFRHNDVDHLERILRCAIAEGQPRTRRPWRKILVLIEGIYSMEGETSPLGEIAALCKRYGAYLFLDEAHSIGAMGGTGRGCCEHEGVSPDLVDVLMGTFTKSFGSCGGYIAGNRDVIEHLRRTSPGCLAAAAMSPAAAQQALSALELILGEDGSDRGIRKIRRLHAASNWMRLKLVDLGLAVEGDWDSPVIPVMLINLSKIAAFSREMLARRIAVVVVGFPATPLMQGRARLCISAGHSLTDLRLALAAIEEVADLIMLRYHRGRPDSIPPEIRALVPSWEAVLAEDDMNDIAMGG